MKIEKLELRYAHRSELESLTTDNIQIIKTLPWLSVVQSQEGSYDIQLNNEPIYRTGDGGFFVAPSLVTQNIIHRLNPQSRRMRFRYIFLDVVINDQYQMEMLYTFPTVLPDDAKEKMNILFDRLFDIEDICDQMSIYFQIIKLLLQTAVPKNFVSNDYLSRTLNFIRDHYTEDISMAQLAANVCISESYLYEIFKKSTGTSPITYLNYYRISLASEMLKQTKEPVYKIAGLVGFKDPAYFTRLFCRTFEMSPSAYRKGV